MFICQQTTNTIKGKHLYHVQFFRFNIFFVCFICLFLFKKNNYIRSNDSFHTERLECIKTMDVQVGTKLEICPIWGPISPNLVPNLTSLIKTTNSLYKKKRLSNVKSAKLEKYLFFFNVCRMIKN